MSEMIERVAMTIDPGLWAQMENGPFIICEIPDNAPIRTRAMTQEEIEDFRARNKPPLMDKALAVIESLWEPSETMLKAGPEAIIIWQNMIDAILGRAEIVPAVEQPEPPQTWRQRRGL